MSYRRNPNQTHFSKGKVTGLPHKIALEFWKSAENADKFCVFRNIGDAEGIGGGDAVPATADEHQKYMLDTMPATLETENLDADEQVTVYFEPQKASSRTQEIAKELTHQDARKFADAMGGIVYVQIGRHTWVKEKKNKVGWVTDLRLSPTGTYVVVTESPIY